jgi:Kdo2-lipid IVA lauroyltransferase/acyltransferase
MSETARELLARDRIKFSHRVEYAAFRGVLAAGSMLNDDAAAAVGAALGRLGYRLGIKRAVVERNLRIAFPDASAARISDLARSSFAHLGRETMMMLRLSTMSKESLIARTRVAGEAQFRAAVDAGAGIVAVAGHLGNWEIGAALMAARGYPVTVIAKRAANPLFYGSILDARERLGIEIIDFQGATRPTIRALRDGRIVAFAADQHAGRAGVQVPYFGRPASTYRGPALMALRTGAPVFLSSTLRLSDGTYELALEPIAVSSTGDFDADVLRLTAEFALRLESAVRRHPEQYLWHHRRWR